MTPKAIERFWSKVKKTEGCWEWQASLNHGYGRFAVTRREIWRAHRLSFAMVNGPIPDGLDVLHTCDNPRCVRPDHLYAGTDLDNARDRKDRGRNRYDIPRVFGERHGSAKLTDAFVRDIRQRYQQGGVTQAQLSREYGVSGPVISQIVRRKLWRHIA